MTIAGEINDQESLFQGKVLAARLLAAANQPTLALAQLTQLCQEFTEPAQQARLYDLLWQIGGERQMAENAAALYRQLLQHAPSVNYQQRLQVLDTYLVPVKD